MRIIIWEIRIWYQEWLWRLVNGKLIATYKSRICTIALYSRWRNCRIDLIIHYLPTSIDKPILSLLYLKTWIPTYRPILMNFSMIIHLTTILIICQGCMIPICLYFNRLITKTRYFLFSKILIRLFNRIGRYMIVCWWRLYYSLICWM